MILVNGAELFTVVIHTLYYKIQVKLTDHELANKILLPFYNRERKLYIYQMGTSFN